MSLSILLLVGCRAPPDAPHGLDDSLRFLIREFHSDDETVGAGLTGLLNWLDTDGKDLLDARADLNDVGTFQLGDLDRSDIDRFDIEGDPDPGTASGVVSVGEMGCGWQDAQALVVRPDQDVVFDTTWDDYQRTWVTDRSTFEGAEDVAPIRDPIGEDQLEDQPDALLITQNQADASQLGFSLQLDLELRFRHGTFDVGGEPTSAFLVLGFMPHRAEGDGQAIDQSYSIDIEVARARHRTLRVFGAWSELDSPLIPSDSPLVLVSGVNEAQDASERMSRICAGDITLPRR